ncbi:globin [Paenibacillus thermotolerans]|uniref:globin domain-containing protein n=1 Tax=Paenibacillus thermotolerans TaxID=3027807 RepID=UPI0023686CF6|nr:MULTISPECIES: globin [unclassified Paenibacillus]
MSETIYEQLGGDETLTRLVEAFYPRVVKNPDLAPLFAGKDIQETARKQKMFLTQFFGGPMLYSEEFGHPMLRYRHLPFEITPRRAEAWLSCMKEALDEAGVAGELREFVIHRLTLTAHHMINSEAPEN